MNDEKLSVIIIGDQLTSLSSKSRLLETLRGLDVVIVDDITKNSQAFNKIWINECHTINDAWEKLRQYNAELMLPVDTRISDYNIGLEHSAEGPSPGAADPIKRVPVGKRNKKLLRAQRGW